MRTRIVATVGAVALVATLLSITPAAAQRGTQIRTSDNYKLGNYTDPVRGKAGPGLAVNPANPNHVVETHMDLPIAQCEHAASFNGGATWTTGVLNPPAGFVQGHGSCDVLGHGSTAIDAGVEFGSGLNVYAAFSSARPAERTSALVAKSTDGGVTFAPAVVAMNPHVAGEHNFPKIDVVPGGGNAGADKIVIATSATRPAAGDHSNAGVVLTSVSMDGGLTWSAPVAVNPAPTAADRFGANEHTHPLFGPGGVIYVAWRTTRVRVSPPDPPQCLPGPPNNPAGCGSITDVEPGFIRVGKSNDNGQTWTIVNATNVFAEPGFGGSAFPRMTIDDNTGNLYLVWNQDAGLYGPGFQAQDHFMIKASQVWFLRSTDGAATWTNRQLLSEPVVAGYQTQTRHPNVEVAPNGRVDVAWHDRRHMIRPRVAGNALGPACLHTHFPCVESKLGDTYWSYSFDQGQSFSESRRISDRSHNNDVGYDYRFSTYWDFGPVMAPLGNTQLLHAWMDSREGNFDTDTQDIYLAKTNFSATGSIPVKGLGTHSAPDLSVALSRLANPGGSEAKQASTFASTSATRVVIANEGDAPSIMAGAALARANVGPLLVTPAGGLPANVRAEVDRMNPIGAYIIGDTNMLSPQIEADLIAAGVPATHTIPDAGAGAGAADISSPGGFFDLADINHPVSGAGVAPGTTFHYVTTLLAATLSAPRTGPLGPLTVQRIIRLGGPTPADTAAAVARQLDRRTPTERASGMPAFDAVILAEPTSNVAATASALSAHRRLPYLFVNKNDIPAATQAALTSLNINKTLVITGKNVISRAVTSQLFSESRNPTVLGGTNLVTTSEAVVRESIHRGLPTNQVFIANGDNPVHGALLGAPAGRIGGLLFAVPGGDPSVAENRLFNMGLKQGLDRMFTSGTTTPPILAAADAETTATTGAPATTTAPPTTSAPRTTSGPTTTAAPTRRAFTSTTAAAAR